MIKPLISGILIVSILLLCILDNIVCYYGPNYLSSLVLFVSQHTECGNGKYVMLRTLCFMQIQVQFLTLLILCIHIKYYIVFILTLNGTTRTDGQSTQDYSLTLLTIVSTFFLSLGTLVVFI